MRRRSLVAILGATGTLLLAAGLVLWFFGGLPGSQRVTSVVVHIPDNPAAGDQAPVVAALPDAADTSPPTQTEPAVPAGQVPADGMAAPDLAGPANETELPGTFGQTPTSETAAPDAAADAAPTAEETSPNGNAHIVDAIRQKLKDPELLGRAYEADLAALDSFYAERVGPPLWVTEEGFSTAAQAAIDELRKADEWGLSSGAFIVPSAGATPSSEEALAAAEIELGLAILKYARHARGGRTNPAALSKIVDQMPVLRDPKSVLAELEAAESPDEYLRSLHPKHDQFQQLRQALLKARAAGAKSADIERLLVNMERWRWMPERLGSPYVQINVPEFMAYIVKDGKTIHADKVVVGKLVYATPVFTADLKSIVFNPEWTVPPTIVREDLLPKLRGGGGMFGGGGSAVLKKHKLSVNYNGRKVDPGSIDWNRVNMGAVSFTQAPGPTNVLGKVKFLYPNKHMVYMHDTIKKGLMDMEVRVEGHNCPRVANPGKFAGVLLAEDQGMGSQQIEKLLASGYNSAVILRNPVPVHTTYFTAVVDREGKVKTHSDVYGLDAVVTKALGKDAKPAPIATEPAAAIAGGRVDLPPRKPDAGQAAPRSGALADSTP